MLGGAKSRAVSDPGTNLRQLVPSRKRLRAGDVFALQIERDRFHFGRVIRAGESLLGWPNANLVYLYRATSRQKMIIPHLRRDGLVVPPLVINRLPWSRGYFETVAHRPLSEADTFPIHCFRNLRGECVSETNEPLPRPIEPCGEAALQSFRSVGDQLSHVLGLALSSD